MKLLKLLKRIDYYLNWELHPLLQWLVAIIVTAPIIYLFCRILF